MSFSSNYSLHVLSSQGRVVKSFPHVDSCALSSVSFVNHNEVFQITFSQNFIDIECYLCPSTKTPILHYRFLPAIELESLMCLTFEMLKIKRLQNWLYQQRMTNDPTVSHALHTIQTKSIL